MVGEVDVALSIDGVFKDELMGQVLLFPEGMLVYRRAVSGR
jgi:hypothetical protein